jgi:4-hydroxy-tetrahydrodipicolinate reductase
MTAKQKSGVWIHGSSGKMGREIQQAVVAPESAFKLIGGSSRRFEGELFHQGKAVTPELLAHTLAKSGIDLVLDFSGEGGNDLLLEAVKQSNVTGKAIIIGTTGLSADQLLRWRAASEAQQLRVLIAPNTSIGILLTVQASLATAGVLSRLGFDIEIVETHHNKKIDAPSGTAKFIARTLVDKIEGLRLALTRSGARQPGEVGVHSVRGGGVFGEHEVRMIGAGEELKISHRAFSRALFASGALVLGEWLLKQPSGSYGLPDVNVADLAYR